MSNKNNYSENSIQVLKGLEPVRARPGMYTRTDSPTHIIAEMIDNAADEALAGYASEIIVSTYLDGSVSVSDNGRGIPTGIHPGEGRPTVEVVFTHLHAGGKFNKDNQSAYAFSGGLHGVGVSVTNALSTRLAVQVKREGQCQQIIFADGEVIAPLQVLGATKENGTFIHAWPNPRYFTSPQVNYQELCHMLQAKAVLLPNLLVILREQQKEQNFQQRHWQYSNGMVSYLAEHINNTNLDSDDFTSPIFTCTRYLNDGELDGYNTGEGIAVALVFSDNSPAFSESYVNLIPTPAGGTHEIGLKNGVMESLREFIAHHALMPSKITLQSEDVWRYLRFVLSVRLLDPQFQGQTKEKLNNREAVKLVANRLKDPFDLWLNQNSSIAKEIANLVISSAVARHKSAKVVEKRKQSNAAVLPGKLTDCESQDIEINEIFLVEGDSAGGSAKQGRDRFSQAILPLRGKILNTWEVNSQEIFANNEVHDIAVALGIDAHAKDSAMTVLSNLRYGKVIIMADADVDGSHIQTLLLSLFVRHFPLLVSSGHLFIAQPPLYVIRADAQGKKLRERRVYALDENERDNVLRHFQEEGYSEKNLHIGRFKGLGEMNPEQLRETTMHPDTRRLLAMNYDLLQTEATALTFNLLMSKAEASKRRLWMEAKGIAENLTG